MIINKIEYIDTAEGQVTVTLSKGEVIQICNSICDFSRPINKDMFTQFIIAKDILDHGAVSGFALSQCSESRDIECKQEGKESRN